MEDRSWNPVGRQRLIAHDAAAPGTSSRAASNNLGMGVEQQQGSVFLAFAPGWQLGGEHILAQSGRREAAMRRFQFIALVAVLVLAFAGWPMSSQAAHGGGSGGHGGSSGAHGGSSGAHGGSSGAHGGSSGAHGGSSGAHGGSSGAHGGGSGGHGGRGGFGSVPKGGWNNDVVRFWFLLWPIRPM